MRAIVVTGPGRFSVREVPGPVAGERALVAPSAMGLCGTDLKILAGAIPVRYPRILGHEMIGTVVRPGAMALFPEGSRVLVDPGIACGHCGLCRNDRTHLCPNGALMGRDVDGGFAGLVAVDESRLHLVPQELSATEASLLQVLGTCVHAHSLVPVFPGQAAVVIGLGVSGLLHVQLLRARGIDRIVGVTRTAWKRQLAERLGATATAAPEDAPRVVEAVTEGAGAELVVESAGQLQALVQAVHLAALGGRILVFGIAGSGPVELPAYELYYKELDVVYARAAQPRDYARAVHLAASGRVRLAPLWSESFPLAEAGRAFEAAGSASSLKITLTGAEEDGHR
ncbi:MAG TPA: alcohol dehydrogenase catalytic domain-containing protein [Actinomycetes bacterium]|jgi:L-iditol 2-dehydrogenase|nr:alcohol dehydrogenase catalytic domain-containing protein [Actinomycetes bacterium]